MKAVFVSCCFFLLVSLVSAQQCIIQIGIKGLSGRKVYLTKIYGHRQTLIDSAISDGNGSFSLAVKKNNPKGIYRVILGPVFRAESQDEPSSSFDLIIDPEKAGTIQLSTTFEHPEDSMKVWQSEENQLYYGYIHKKQLYHKRLQMLEQLLETYPQDKFYTQIQKQYNRLQKESLAWTKALIKEHPSAFFTLIVQLEQFPFLDARLTQEDRLKILKAHLLKPIHFQDTLLLYSDALSNKILTWLSLYRLLSYNEKEQTTAFIKAVDQLMPMAKSGHPAVYKFVYQYMIEGFNQIGQNEVIAYLAEHYPALSDICMITDEKLNRIVRKAEDYKRTAIGAKAPDIILSDSSALSGIRADYTLVFFWASWCPHCTTMLPGMQQLYKKYRRENVEIVAVSIDHDKAAWARTIEQGKYNWINFTDLQGWESPAARAYNIHATPAMFLLDKNKTIIAKPETLQELYRLINADQKSSNQIKEEPKTCF